MGFWSIWRRLQYAPQPAELPDSSRWNWPFVSEGRSSGDKWKEKESWLRSIRLCREESKDMMFVRERDEREDDNLYSLMLFFKNSGGFAMMPCHHTLLGGYPALAHSCLSSDQRH